MSLNLHNIFTKILFLDMDGVLNSMPDNNKLGNWRRFLSKEELNQRLYGISPDLARNLKYVIDNTNCKIVFSSSWRYFKDHPIVGPDWRKSLAEMLGVSQDIFIGNTPNISECGGWESGTITRIRGTEIKYWLENNTESGKFTYCVVDDEVVDIVSVIPKDHVVHTDMKHGLTMENAKQIINILNKN